MTTTLLTFLGRVPKGENGYRRTRYDFGDGSPTEPAAFFGWPLRRRIAAGRLVIMGTSGSMWDHLFEGDIAFGSEEEAARWRLVEATEAKAVTAQLLGPLQEPLARRLGCQVRLVLIPYCRNEREQIDLVSIMAQHVEPRDTVHIDVSHGFRHLPIIALLAALHLRVVRQAQIGGIWYGAFDPDTNEAPVHNLVGLLRIADWIEALHTYDKDGDYGVFAPLLGPAGGLLSRAAFFERTTNPVKAREMLTAWTGRPDRSPDQDPAAQLFREELEQRVCWFRQPDRAAWERELAKRHLRHRDYVRAAIYGLEAVVSRQVLQGGGDPGDFAQRADARDRLRRQGELLDFRRLNILRNALAHGVRSPDRSLQRILREEKSLRRFLQAMFSKLF